MDSRLVRILVAIAAAVISIGARLLLDEVAGAGSYYTIFIPGVVFSAWYGGLKPGLITTLILSIAAWQMAPATVSGPAMGLEPVRLALFVVASISICVAMQKVRTERLAAQQAQHRLNAVLESTNDAIFSLDSDLRITYANESAARVARRSPDQLKGKSLRTVFPENPRVVLYRELSRGLREQKPVHVEDGLEAAQQWFSFSAYPVAAGLNVFARDITAEKKLEIGQSRESPAVREHARVEMALRELPVGVLIVSANLRVELANAAATEIFGADLKPGDLLPEVCTGTLRSVDGKLLNTEAWPIATVSRGGAPVSNLEAVYTPFGQRSRSIIVNCIPVFGKSGAITGVIATYSDVTSLRQAERELIISENRLQRLFETPALGIISGQGERILQANDAFLRMLGLARETVEDGKFTWTSITPPGYEEVDSKALRELDERGFTDPFEKDYIRSDGERVSVLVGCAACEPDDSWIAWILDRTEHHRLERRLRDAARLESIGLLAGGIAHDFNNILTGVLGNASISLEMMNAQDPARGPLETAIVCTERAADLTRQLLAYAGKGNFIVGPVDISKLTRDISRLISTSIPRTAELELQLPDGLPQVEADAVQMQQLIMNLVINAAEALTGEGGTVRVSASEVDIDEAWIQSASLELAPGHYISLEVHDTGCGMDEMTLQRIFDPFFTTKFTGRGLGLAAAMGIARSHKGAIKVYSAPGVGSTFRVLLPAMTERVTLPRSRPQTAHRRERGSGTVLVVDDEEMVRRVAKTALEKYGYTVLVASNGRQALDIYRGLSHSISMVLLDMTMPVMGGEEALRNLRAMSPQLKILVSSGFNEPEVVRRASDRGLAGFIQKPYTAEALAARVQTILQEAQAS